MMLMCEVRSEARGPLHGRWATVDAAENKALDVSAHNPTDTVMVISDGSVISRFKAGQRMIVATQVQVELLDNTVRVFTAYPVREGWHAAPPCSDRQSVYATPRDAVLAHAQNIGLANVYDAKVVS